MQLLSERQDVLVGTVLNKRTCRKKRPKSIKKRCSRSSRSLRSKGRAKEAYAHKVGSRKGKNDNFANIGRFDSE